MKGWDFRLVQLEHRPRVQDVATATCQLVLRKVPIGITHQSHAISGRIVEHGCRIANSWGRRDSEQAAVYDQESLPSPTLDARSNTPMTGFVTALFRGQHKSIPTNIPRHSPNQALPYTLEEASGAFRFSALNRLHLRVAKNNA